MNKSDFLKLIKESLQEALSPAEESKLRKADADIQKIDLDVGKIKAKMAPLQKKEAEFNRRKKASMAKDTLKTIKSTQGVAEVIGDGTLLPEGSYEDYNWFEKGNWIGIWSSKWTGETVADMAIWLHTKKMCVHKKTYRNTPVLLVHKADKDKLITFLKNIHDEDLIDIGQSIESPEQVKTPLMEALNQFTQFNKLESMVVEELKRFKSELSKLSENEMSGDEDIGVMAMESAERMLNKMGSNKDDQDFYDKSEKLAKTLQDGIKISKVYEVAIQPSNIVGTLTES